MIYGGATEQMGTCAMADFRVVLLMRELNVTATDGFGSMIGSFLPKIEFIDDEEKFVAALISYIEEPENSRYELAYNLRRIFGAHRSLIEPFFKCLMEFETVDSEHCCQMACPCIQAYSRDVLRVDIFHISLKCLYGLYAPDFEEILLELSTEIEDEHFRRDIRAILEDFYSSNPDMLNI